MNYEPLLKKKLKDNRKSFLDFVRGKRVVVVGPAPSIVGSKQKDYIDSFDVVVRLNKAIPLPVSLIPDIGTRTDILYNCMNPSEECGGKIDVITLRNNGVKFLVSPYAPTQTTDKRFIRFKQDIYNFIVNNTDDDMSISHIDPDYFTSLLKIMKLPNTGVNAILDLLSTDIAELYITGFTFFKGGYYKEYRRYNEKQVLERMDKYGLHDQDKQMEHMKEVLLSDSRVKMDRTLMEIIMEYKPQAPLLSSLSISQPGNDTAINSSTSVKKLKPTAVNRQQGAVASPKGISKPSQNKAKSADSKPKPKTRVINLRKDTNKTNNNNTKGAKSVIPMHTSSGSLIW